MPCCRGYRSFRSKMAPRRYHGRLRISPHDHLEMRLRLMQHPSRAPRFWPPRPGCLEDLRDNVFLQYDLSIYNFIIQLNQSLRAQGRDLAPVTRPDFLMISDTPIDLARLVVARSTVATGQTARFCRRLQPLVRSASCWGHRGRCCPGENAHDSHARLCSRGRRGRQRRLRGPNRRAVRVSSHGAGQCPTA
jgi:hypothetical protein